MITCKTPLRISLFGGSTDHPDFLQKHDWGICISFPINIFTYCSISKDIYGENHQNGNYILNYSKREKVNNYSLIQNELIKNVLHFHDLPPLNITLTSDIFSQGSGLASSSSYIISMLKAIHFQKGKSVNLEKLCRQALVIERKFNKLCGIQDPYGCGIPDFKILEFDKKEVVATTFLNNELFKRYCFFLLPTAVNRNSKNILADLSNNKDTILNLREQHLKLKN